MRKFIAFILCLIIIFTNTLLVFSDDIIGPTVDANSVLLVDSLRGQILYSKNETDKLHISFASKIMTAIVAIEKSQLDSLITVSKESTNVEGSLLNLTVGEKYSVENLLYAILVTNYNDAANALAEYVAGDIPSFVEIMNDYATKLNMKDTVFTNPTGLFDENQYTTANDISLLLKYALKDKVFSKIFSTQSKLWYDKKDTKLLVNQNQLFWSFQGVDGGKIGYTDPTKMSCVTTASKGDQRLLCIVLNSPKNSVYEDSVKLLDFGFEYFRTGLLVAKGQVIQSVIINTIPVNLAPIKDVYYTFPIGNDYIKDISITRYEDIKLPIYTNTPLGEAKYTLEDDTNIIVQLFSDKEILPTKSTLDKYKEEINKNKEILYIIYILIIMEIIILIIKFIRKVKKEQ